MARNQKQNAKRSQQSEGSGKDNDHADQPPNLNKAPGPKPDEHVADPSQWTLYLLLLAAIEFVKVGSSEREAARKAHALLKECEKILQEGSTTGTKPVSVKTKPILSNAGPIPIEPAFKDYFCDGKYLSWEEGIVAITGDKRLDRAEEKFRMFLKTRSFRALDVTPEKVLNQPGVISTICQIVPIPETDLADTLANLKENGFPPGQIESYREEFSEWQRREKSRKGSESGKKGAARRHLNSR
jgi:hypothetical protein